MFVEPGKTYITRLRAQSRTRDPLALRMRLDQKLSMLNLQPHGLSPKAIICIRRLREPVPGALAARRSRHAPPPQEWERAFIETLNQIVRRAARPALGPVAPDSEAVFFADKAELLACLASDWCESAIATRWWWPNLLKRMPVERALLSAWLDAPQYVPPALEHLARAGHLLPFVRALRDDSARAILQSVLRAFALHEVGNALHDAPRPDAPAPSAVPDADRATLTQHASQIPAEAHAAPWLPYAPELRAVDISLEQQTFVGVALTLLRAPAVVRSRAFPCRVAQWRQFALHAQDATQTSSIHAMREQAGEFEKAAEPAFAPDHASGHRTETRAVTFEETGHQGRSVSLPDLTPQTESTRRAERFSQLQSDGMELEIEERRLVQEPSQSFVPVAGRAAFENRSRSGAEPGEDADAVELAERAGPESEQKAADVEAGREAAWWSRARSLRRVETEMGGLFYLLNLGLFLNLYGDFTTPLAPGIELPVWDFVALVGRELCGEVIESDPVWSLLATLAGREACDEPGHDFDAPSEWRVPPSWLAPFRAEGEWKWAATGGRLRVCHSEGFPVVDVPLDADDVIRQLRAELSVHEKHAVGGWRRVAALGLEERRGRAGRWLSWLMPYVSARLRRACGVSPETDVGRLICARPARVEVTATHLDVVLTLAGLPFEVRLSGLDRDPGWMPAAGRYIAFRYE